MNSIDYKEKLRFVKNFLKSNDAKLIAHYYVNSEIQKLAEDSGGECGLGLTDDLGHASKGRGRVRRRAGEHDAPGDTSTRAST